MTRNAKPLPLVVAWRNAIRDSDLHRTDKLIAYTLSTYMNAAGVAFPSKATIARGASLTSTRVVDGAVNRMAAAGYLVVDRPPVGDGRSSNTYSAVIPPHARAGDGGATMQGAGARSNGNPPTGMRYPPLDGAHEVDLEIEKEGDLHHLVSEGSGPPKMNCSECGGKLEHFASDAPHLLYCHPCRLTHDTRGKAAA